MINIKKTSWTYKFFIQIPDAEKDSNLPMYNYVKVMTPVFVFLLTFVAMFFGIGLSILTSNDELFNTFNSGFHSMIIVFMAVLVIYLLSSILFDYFFSDYKNKIKKNINDYLAKRITFT